MLGSGASDSYGVSAQADDRSQDLMLAVCEATSSTKPSPTSDDPGGLEVGARRSDCFNQVTDACVVGGRAVARRRRVQRGVVSDTVEPALPDVEICGSGDRGLFLIWHRSLLCVLSLIQATVKARADPGLTLTSIDDSSEARCSAGLWSAVFDSDAKAMLSEGLT